MESTIANLASYIPAEVDILSMLKFIAIFALGSLFLGLLGRVTLGKRSGLNHALSSAMGILFLYALAVVVCTFNPGDLAQHLAPLPFVTFSGEKLYVFSYLNTDFPSLCSQIMSMIILAFLVNLLDTLIPQGKSVIVWYLLRLVTVVLAIVTHAVVSVAIETYLPGILVTYAPILLLGILLGMLLLGLLKLVLGVVLTIANPIIGALYAFFFSNLIGKQLSKAVLTTLVMCAIVFVLEYFGYTVITIASAALPSYIPLIVALLILWYLIGHVL